MNRLFGNKATAPKPSLQDAIAGVETRISTLDVKIAKLNGELATYQDKLAHIREGPGKQAIKQRAMKILRQRKQIEAQKDQLESQSWNMECATMTQDNLRNTMATVDAMKEANKQLKKQYGNVNIDKIEKLQDEMADLLDMNEEIQETMSRSYQVPEDIDETELDAELDALYVEQETQESAMPSYLAAPDSNPPQFVDEEEMVSNDVLAP